MRFIRSCFNIMPMLLVLVLMSLPAIAENKAPRVPQPGEMVWPSPPQEARVSFQTMITEKDKFGSQKKKNRSWLDRLVGEKQEKDKMALYRPYGIAVGEDGRIFVADSGQQAIVVLDQENHTITKWTGNNRIQLALPVGLALDRDSRLFVSDSRRGQVVIFDQQGKAVKSVAGDPMVRPGGLAIDDHRGRLYVGDLGLHKILVYDLRTLKLVNTIGRDFGDRGPEMLYTPANLALDRAGNLFVSDTLQCRVVVFNSQGEFIRSFGQRGDNIGEFARPKGIAIDSDGHVYVADAAFGNIQIFNPDGQLLLTVSSGGASPGYLNLPTGLAIDSQDRIYISEHWKGDAGRLQIFQYLSEQDTPLVAEGAKEIR